MWEWNDPRRKEIIRHRFTTADQFVLWVKHQQGNSVEVAANGILVLLTVTCNLLDRQLTYQAETFQREGGFTERLYRFRKKHSLSSIVHIVHSVHAVHTLDLGEAIRL